ncbi:MAG TPA: N-acetyltransferase [Terracidiphilus sp.]|nr:N-acetyltransferase [Terracidiphilus sp.]
MHYRAYHPDDFSSLYSIEEICFQRPIRFPRRYMKSLIDRSDSATWVAEEQGIQAGFAIVDWDGSPPDRSAYIQTIEVAPDFRRRGIGAELLNRVEESARSAGAAEIWLHVDVHNEPAIRLYQSSGYRLQGRQDHYYARHHPADLYAKQLYSSTRD